MTAQLTQEQFKLLLADQTIQIRSMEIENQQLRQRVQDLTDELTALKTEKEGNDYGEDV